MYSIAWGTSFDCDRNRCGLKTDGSYPHLVLGTVQKVASDTDTAAVYRWAKEYGYWADLPDNQGNFIRSIQMMSVEITGQGSTEEITLLMGREHYDAIVIKAGDLVRYTPHEMTQPIPEDTEDTNRLYWNIFGCIAVLCRADDGKCFERYSTGIYGVADGIGLNSHGEVSEEVTRRIDPITYLPIRSRID
ncbi:hypothetical protein [Marinobacterium sedimentorum]|uniref:hypothetical protein n=1 Tax=Marinobacterium sedimentorum TaxID=2927804 RepID=UPI0020C72E11|nr:hypothetical protein [Marinobacterium sedimentorum]MCP8690104.1 hypothetical protein [Marinobacterium sedimentorum]